MLYLMMIKRLTAGFTMTRYYSVVIVGLMLLVLSFGPAHIAGYAATPISRPAVPLVAGQVAKGSVQSTGQSRQFILSRTYDKRQKGAAATQDIVVMFNSPWSLSVSHDYSVSMTLDDG